MSATSIALWEVTRNRPNPPTPTLNPAPSNTNDTKNGPEGAPEIAAAVAAIAKAISNTHHTNVAHPAAHSAQTLTQANGNTESAPELPQSVPATSTEPKQTPTDLAPIDTPSEDISEKVASLISRLAQDRSSLVPHQSALLTRKVQATLAPVIPITTPLSATTAAGGRTITPSDVMARAAQSVSSGVEHRVEMKSASLLSAYFAVVNSLRPAASLPVINTSALPLDTQERNSLPLTIAKLLGLAPTADLIPQSTNTNALNAPITTATSAPDPFAKNSDNKPANGRSNASASATTSASTNTNAHAAANNTTTESANDPTITPITVLKNTSTQIIAKTTESTPTTINTAALRTAAPAAAPHLRIIDSTAKPPSGLATTSPVAAPAPSAAITAPQYRMMPLLNVSTAASTIIKTTTATTTTTAHFVPSGESTVLSAEPITPSLRIEPLPSEILPIQVKAEVARDLGLKDGQIVQGTLENSGDSVRLKILGESLDFPINTPRPPMNEPWQWRVSITANGVTLRPMGPANPALSSLANSLSANTTSAPELALSTLALLQRPAEGAALNTVLGNSLWQNAPQVTGLPNFMALLRNVLPSMGQLNPETMRQAVATSGLFTESQLGGGLTVASRDLKVLLRRMMRTLPAETTDLNSIGEALDDIQSAQLKAVQAQAQGQILWQMQLPFADSPPVRLTIQRDAPTPDQPRPPYVFEVHTENPAIGEVWLKSALNSELEVSLTMWARRPEIAQLANIAQSKLASELRAAGLTMTEFKAYPGSRPEATPKNSPPGSLLNVQA